MKARAGVGYAFGAASVFGCSTPFAKRLGDGVSPQVFAGLLYLGSGLGLAATLLIFPSGGRESSLQKADRGPLFLAVVFGGMLGPLLLMIGLRTTPAATTALLLNLEAVFTALGAWLVVKEHADRRIVIAMMIIVAGGVLLSINPSGGFAITAGAMAIVGACACWGVDNVATRPLGLRDPRQVGAVKGVFAGTANLGIGLVAGGHLPRLSIIAGAVVLGFFGYGLSLVLYIKALRVLGIARTGAYYAAAPFFGAGIALVWLREPVGRMFVPAVGLMAIGLAIHLTERHRHDHAHIALTHAHRHVHADIHHLHTTDDNDAPVDEAAHADVHTHATTQHDHDHTPDEHHIHEH